jgi:hypothetical protein
MTHTRRPLDWGWMLGLFVLAIGAGFGALGVVGYRSGETGVAAITWVLVVGLLFGWLGVTLVRKSIAANRATLKRNRRARAHPDEPWRWLPEWEGDRAVQSDQRFGTTVLELRTMPVRLGGVLEGTIHTSLPVVPPGGFDLHILVQQATRTPGGKRGGSETSSVLWQDARTVAATSTASGVVIDVTLAIPADLPETNDSSQWLEVRWLLGVAASVDGRQYHALFTLPVFH